MIVLTYGTLYYELERIEGGKDFEGMNMMGLSYYGWC